MKNVIFNALNNYKTSAPSPSIPDGKYYVHSIIDDDYVWDIDMNSWNLLLWKKHGRKNQQFIFKYIGNGLYSISNVANGKYLECQWNRTNNGANVHTTNFNDIQAQHWYISKRDTLFKKNLITVYPELGYMNMRRCIDLTWANASTGVNIYLWAENGTNAQVWRLEPIDD